MASLHTGLAESGVSPVEATLRILASELGGLTSWLAMQDDPVQASTAMQRFGNLIRATPSLRAHQRDMMDELIAVAAEILAERAGMSPDDPEPQIAATALLGLWHIHFQGLKQYLDGTRTPAQGHKAVIADVRRAAQLIDTGLSSGMLAALIDSKCGNALTRRGIARQDGCSLLEVDRQATRGLRLFVADR